ncbi:hypothetical protein Pmar_PMAR002628 [Perkinsus marinus ATCC 50983]|uniref:Uncharacterized protein n=1 Tax=Perkinsus marinus (strain ATCC 50983 / TXsc) TaxID=423536 RepID=C5LNV2_PERM5|nr:hypothetical protein Pmar_PMAR002628 [Perkinsus marinus ATCC 50983]EER01593.1 hypothetical protein Pmar_PMAR002628 [Perkinsus marinus ATCC 50983]|eukprot:XP_002768875.1 hypothetical protein Pmar_PMAR002628 [Perkinsus marinus ATCC 50983]
MNSTTLKNAVNGVGSCLKAAGGGILAGATTLVAAPIVGVKEKGAGGSFTGLAKGTDVTIILNNIETTIIILLHILRLLYEFNNILWRHIRGVGRSTTIIDFKSEWDNATQCCKKAELAKEPPRLETPANPAVAAVEEEEEEDEDKKIEMEALVLRDDLITFMRKIEAEQAVQASQVIVVLSEVIDEDEFSSRRQLRRLSRRNDTPRGGIENKDFTKDEGGGILYSMSTFTFHSTSMSITHAGAMESEIIHQPARELPRRKDAGRSSALLLASTPPAAAQGLHQGRVQSAVVDFTVEPMTWADSREPPTEKLSEVSMAVTQIRNILAIAMAATKNDIEACNMAIESGAELDSSHPRNGFTPLQTAEVFGRISDEVDPEGTVQVVKGDPHPTPVRRRSPYRRVYLSSTSGREDLFLGAFVPVYTYVVDRVLGVLDTSCLFVEYGGMEKLPRRRRRVDRSMLPINSIINLMKDRMASREYDTSLDIISRVVNYYPHQTLSRSRVAAEGHGNGFEGDGISSSVEALCCIAVGCNGEEDGARDGFGNGGKIHVEDRHHMIRFLCLDAFYKLQWVHLLMGVLLLALDMLQRIGDDSQSTESGASPCPSSTPSTVLSDAVEHVLWWFERTTSVKRLHNDGAQQAEWGLPGAKTLTRRVKGEDLGRQTIAAGVKIAPFAKPLRKRDGSSSSVAEELGNMSVADRDHRAKMSPRWLSMTVLVCVRKWLTCLMVVVGTMLSLTKATVMERTPLMDPMQSQAFLMNILLIVLNWPVDFDTLLMGAPVASEASSSSHRYPGMLAHLKTVMLNICRDDDYIVMAEAKPIVLWYLVTHNDHVRAIVYRVMNARAPGGVHEEVSVVGCRDRTREALGTHKRRP